MSGSFSALSPGQFGIQYIEMFVCRQSGEREEKEKTILSSTSRFRSPALPLRSNAKNGRLQAERILRSQPLLNCLQLFEGIESDEVIEGGGNAGKRSADRCEGPGSVEAAAWTVLFHDPGGSWRRGYCGRRAEGSRPMACFSKKSAEINGIFPLILKARRGRRFSWVWPERPMSSSKGFGRAW